MVVERSCERIGEKQRTSKLVCRVMIAVAPKVPEVVGERSLKMRRLRN